MEIRKAYTDDFDAIYPLLLGFNNTSISKDDWKKLFTPKYRTEEDFFGYYMLEDEKIVGFFGLIFSERLIGGEMKKFTNLTSWIVLPEYRNYSIALFVKVLKIPGTIFTGLSVNPNLEQIYSRMQFKLVDKYFLITPPLLPFNLFNELKFISDVNKIYDLVSDFESKLIDDHKYLNCKPFLFIKNKKKCLVFANRIYKKKIPFAEILYVSDKTLFTNHIYRISWLICRKLGSVALYTGEHFVTSKPLISFSFQRKTYFKGDGIGSDDFDFLYSELT